MNWWKKIWNRKRTPPVSLPPKPAPPPKPVQESPPISPVSAVPPTQAIPAKSLKALTNLIAPSPAPTEEKWVDYEVISRFKETSDETVILKQIGSTFPGAGSDEVLFRYYLSRSVYFREYALPQLPSSASRILALSQRFDASLADYLNVIEPDPGLIKAIIRLANSVSYATSTEFTTLSQALAHIGLKEVERLALAQAMGNRVFRIQSHESLAAALIRHLLAAAAGAQLVARHLNGVQADAFLAGLFHDTGKLVILNIISDVQRKLKHIVSQPLIQSAFETFHIPVGENACRAWNLPDHIANAVGQHHCVPSPENKLECSVVLGNLIAHIIELEDASFSLEQEDPFLTTLGVTPDGLSLMTVLTKVKLAEYTGVL